MYRALVMDFFGVICSEVAPPWLGRYFSPEKGVEIKATIVHAADRGEISEAAMFDQLGRLAGVTAACAAAEWEKEVRIDCGMVEFVKAAMLRYEIGLLTNSPSPFVRKILREHNLAPLFKAIVVSSEIGIAKPEVGAYERILGELGASASEAFIVDDNPVNVRAAGEMGIRGLVYRSVTDLREVMPV